MDKNRCPRCFGKVCQVLTLDILTGIGKVDIGQGQVPQVLQQGLPGAYFRHSNLNREGGHWTRTGAPGASARSFRCLLDILTGTGTVDKDRCPRCFGEVFQVLTLNILTGVRKVDKDRCPRCFGKYFD